MSNLGNVDRIARGVVGLILVIASLAFGGSIGTILAIVGVTLSFALLVTALIGFCPIYAFLGFTSKRRPSP
jgi:hypothetical protein